MKARPGAPLTGLVSKIILKAEVSAESICRRGIPILSGKRLTVEEISLHERPGLHAGVEGRGRIVLRLVAARGKGLDVHQSDARALVEVSGKSQPADDRDLTPFRIQTDASGIERPDGRDPIAGEDIIVLQEESAPFGKEDVKTRQVGDLPVHFDLREIRVDRHIEIKRGADGQFPIKSSVEISGQRVSGFTIAGKSARHVRDEGPIEPGRSRRWFRPY